MRNSRTINLIVYGPKSPENKKRLSEIIAQVHADAAFRAIQRLDTNPEQKEALVDAVIETSRKLREKQR